MLIEVCVDSPQGLLAAVAGGADRVELCSALALGGLTPTQTLMAQANTAGIPAVVMIRPRAGDFIWSAYEIHHMRAEIDAALAMGMQGIVIGANRPDGKLDVTALQALLDGLGPSVEKVLHRAIDLTPDPVAAVETAIELGFDRILTSGGALRALDGLDQLSAMFEKAQGRIVIMPGSGINAENVAALLAVLPVSQIHASCAMEHAQDKRAVAMGFCAAVAKTTDAQLVQSLRQAVQSVCSG